MVHRLLLVLEMSFLCALFPELASSEAAKTISLKDLAGYSWDLGI